VSLGLAIAGVLLVVVDGLGMRGVYPVVQYKPAWLLTAEAYLLGDRRASVATAEIYSRTTAGTLDASWQDRLVRISLDRHAQTWRVFPDAQWQVIIEAMGNRRLTTAQIRGVLDNVIEDAFVDAYRVHRDNGGFVARNDWEQGLPLEPGDMCVIEIGVNFRAGQLLMNRPGTRLWSVNPRTVLNIHEEIDTRIYAEPSLVELYFVRRSRPVGGQPRIDVHDAVLLNAPWIEGVYTGAVEFRVDASGILQNASDANVVVPGTYSNYISREIPIEFEVVSNDRHSFPVLDVASLPSDASAYVELRREEYKHQQYSLVELPEYYIRLKQGEGIDWSETAMAGHVVLRQGDRVYRKTVYQSSGDQNEIDLDLFLMFILQTSPFEPGEVRVTYEHNEAFAAYSYRSGRGGFKQILGGPIELGTIELPGKK